MPEDAKHFARYRNLPEVALYQGWSLPYTEDRAMDLISHMQGKAPGQPGWFQFALESRETGTLIGDIGFKALDAKQAEVGFTLSPEHWGRGYATEGLTAVLDHAFGLLQFHRVVAATDPRNQRSQKVLQRLGFRHEAHMIEAYFDGTNWLDEDRFALLAREWKLLREAEEPQPSTVLLSSGMPRIP